ncbi:uncharacterized protein LOC135200647 [Macrobrachium nipponense]|uniref:uncharacterized protein LOC135200647 n=1 Tax=Macrobrachium nipponense TaxID=159736 RepID=UPI0030C8BC11
MERRLLRETDRSGEIVLTKGPVQKRSFVYGLNTIVAEAENIINNRPLTYVNEDNADIALTPAILLYGRAITMAPPLNKFVDVPFNENVELRENYARLCETIRKFEKLWLLDYLTSLRERHRNTESSNICPLSIGDLVLIVNGNCKRHKYPLGIIEKLHAGPDNVIRTVEIKTASGNFTRPLNHVIPLECNVREESTTESGQNEVGETSEASNEASHINMTTKKTMERAEIKDVRDGLESVAEDAPTTTTGSPPLQVMSDRRPMRRTAAKADEQRKQLIREEAL